MEINKLIAIVSILITLSIASERLVEIIKGRFPGLNEENLEAKAEARRKAKISVLAVISGIITAGLSSSLLKETIKDLSKIDTSNTGEYIFVILALGLLASGGSAFWNSILEYLLKVKDLKETNVKREKVEVEKAKKLGDLEIEKVRDLNKIEVDKARELKSLEIRSLERKLTPPAKSEK